MNVTMKIGGVQETVTVTADAAAGRDAQHQRRHHGDRGADGRPAAERPQPSQLILLSGSAVENGGSGALTGSQRQYPSAVAISVAGGTGNSTMYLVDGGYNNDPQNNTGNADAVSRRAAGVQTENGVRPARYGMYTGATVNAVTKSGSNSFHGIAFDFVRAPPLNSLRYFDIAD